MPTIEHGAPPIDQKDRALTLDTSRSFLVQAPAGSGKTELLTRRLLKLLAEVDEPEQILAITFTLAATAEMRARVLTALEQAAANPDDEREEVQPGPGCADQRQGTRMESTATATATEYSDHRFCLPGNCSRDSPALAAGRIPYPD